MTWEQLKMRAERDLPQPDDRVLIAGPGGLYEVVDGRSFDGFLVLEVSKLDAERTFLRKRGPA